MTKQEFEYLTECWRGELGSDAHTHYVNAIAAHGWRLISTDHKKEVYFHESVLYFERPVSAPSE